MRKLVMTALLGAAAVLPQAANAAAYIITFNNGFASVNPAPQLTPNETVDANGNTTAVTGPAYSDTFSFTTNSAATLSGNFSTQRLRVPAGTGTIVSDLDFVSGTLSKVGGGFAAVPFNVPAGQTDASEQLSLFSTDLSAGSYVITVDYNVSAADANHGAGYSGTFNLGTTSAVPEPAAWAMFIAGFGAIGAGMRRRRENLSLVRL